MSPNQFYSTTVKREALLTEQQRQMYRTWPHEAKESRWSLLWEFNRALCRMGGDPEADGKNERLTQRYEVRRAGCPPGNL